MIGRRHAPCDGPGGAAVSPTAAFRFREAPNGTLTDHSRAGIPKPAGTAIVALPMARPKRWPIGFVNPNHQPVGSVAKPVRHSRGHMQYY